jgi:hypothetical protein
MALVLWGHYFIDMCIDKSLDFTIFTPLCLLYYTIEISFQMVGYNFI